MSNINYPASFTKPLQTQYLTTGLVTRTFQKKKSRAVIIRSSTPHATDLPINNNNTSHYHSTPTSDIHFPSMLSGHQNPKPSLSRHKAKLFLLLSSRALTSAFLFRVCGGCGGAVRALLAFLEQPQPSPAAEMEM
jgi:hypothetical protein